MDDDVERNLEREGSRPAPQSPALRVLRPSRRAITTAAAVVAVLVLVAAGCGSDSGNQAQSVVLEPGERLGDGTQLPANGKLYALTYTSPAKLIVWDDPGDLAKYTVTTFPATGQYDKPQHLIYEPATKRLYAGFTSFQKEGDDFTDWFHRIVEIDPENVAAYKTLVDFSVGEQHSKSLGLTSDGTFIYACTQSTFEPARIYKFRLDGSFVAKTQLANTDARNAHVLRTDGKRLYLAGTRPRTPWKMWVAWVERDFSAQDYLQIGATGQNLVTDDSIFTGDEIWLLDESPGGVVHAVKKDLSSQKLIDTGSSAGLDGALLADGVVRVGAKGSPSSVVSIDPGSHTVDATLKLSGDQQAINEILDWNDSLILLTYQNPSRAIRVPK